MLEQRLPRVIGDADLGPNVLELGPGPGLTTDLLRMSLKRLTVLELDPKYARALTARLQGGTVQIVEGDATDMPFGNAEFSGVVSFTMLHHVPSNCRTKSCGKYFGFCSPAVSLWAAIAW
jgi:16S rRNA A1518/A1519 N6-dimethyltransferase RsmA/KsgA/DIM1 with predicted DNA glycosylase/AP lyase activity